MRSVCAATAANLRPGLDMRLSHRTKCGMALGAHLTVATDSALNRYLRGMSGEIMQDTVIAAQYDPTYSGTQHLDDLGLDVK